MATLALDKARVFKTEPRVTEDLPVITSDIIYRGAAVGKSSGYARPLSAGDAFLGFAEAKADNSAGASGAIDVAVRVKGMVKLAVTGVTAVTDEGSTVYASDDDTFTLSSTSNTAIGKISKWVTSTTCWVYFESVSQRSL